MSTPVIEASNLGVRYVLHHGKSPLAYFCRHVLGRGNDGRPDHIWALRDVSFHVGEGEIVGITGRNGAGKSTLFLVLSEILAVDEGHLDIHGKISTLLTISAGFKPELTGRENLYMSASLIGLPLRRIREEEEAIIAFAELEDFIDEPIKTYSAGMKARLGFAIAVHVRPDILLIDEVLSVGDESFRAKSRQRIQRLLGAARAILIVSHDLEFIRKNCSRAIWMEAGRIREDGEPNQVVDNYIRFCIELRQKVERRVQEAAAQA